MMNDLVQNSAHVPDQQQVHENITLPRTRFGGHHFVDRKRPTRPKTQEHPDFKPTDSGKTEVFDGKWHMGFSSWHADDTDTQDFHRSIPFENFICIHH